MASNIFISHHTLGEYRQKLPANATLCFLIGDDEVRVSIERNCLKIIGTEGFRREMIIKPISSESLEIRFIDRKFTL